MNKTTASINQLLAKLKPVYVVKDTLVAAYVSY